MFLNVAGWWISAQLLGVSALPLAAWFFRRLPDRGYSFARPLGLLLCGYGAWLLSMLGLGAFGRGLLILIALLIAAGGVSLLGRSGLQRAAADLRAQVPWIALIEAVFALGLFVGVWMRWHDIFGRGVDLLHTEQPMDLTLLSGILNSAQFPPQDPWFAQYSINYYYLGYLLVAALIRLSGTDVGSGFTLGIATIWAFSATGTAGLIYNMMGLAGQRRRDGETERGGDGEPMTPGKFGDNLQEKLVPSDNLSGVGPPNAPSRYLVPLLGVVLVLLVGNQAATLQILAGSEKVVAYNAGEAAAAVLNGLGAREALAVPQSVVPTDLASGETQLVPWQGGVDRGALAWWSSRAIWDELPQPGGQTVRAYAITEFPLFSFLLGDLHPHVLSLPWSLLALAVALNVLARRSAPELRARGGWAELAITGIVLGGLYAINSWDLPTYVLIYLGALTLLYLRLAPSPRQFFWPHYLQQAAAVVIASYMLYLPFHISFDAPTSNPPIGIAPSHTSLWHFMVVFGLFVVPLVAFVFRESREVANQQTNKPANQQTNKPTNQAEHRTQNTEQGGENVALDTGKWQPEAANVKRGTWNLEQRLSVRNVALALALILIAGIALGWPLFVLLPLALLASWEAYRSSGQPGVAFGLWMFAVGALVVWGCDVVYLRDSYGTPRMNTIFKFYYQVWLIWGAATAFALWRLFGRLRPVSLLWLAPTALLLVSSMSYLLVAPNRAVPRRELDGLAYLSREAPDEAAAVAWVRQNTPMDAVIAMAPGGAYNPNSSRIASATGRPTIVGWTQHERLWRGGQPDVAAQVSQREQDLTALYTSPDPATAQQTLGKYGARYVYVGPNERNLAAAGNAPPEALTKFDQFMSRVFEQGDIILYQVR